MQSDSFVEILGANREGLIWSHLPCIVKLSQEFRSMVPLAMSLKTDLQSVSSGLSAESLDSELRAYQESSKASDQGEKLALALDRYGDGKDEQKYIW